MPSEKDFGGQVCWRASTDVVFRSFSFCHLHTSQTTLSTQAAACARKHHCTTNSTKQSSVGMTLPGQESLPPALERAWQLYSAGDLETLVGELLTDDVEVKVPCAADSVVSAPFTGVPPPS